MPAVSARKLLPLWKKMVQRAYRGGYGRLHLGTLAQARRYFQNEAHEACPPTATYAVPGGHRIKRFEPTTVSSSREKPPALMLVGGSAFVADLSHRFHDWAQAFAERLKWPVFLLEHRLAPEYKFPTPVNDILEGVRWVANNAQRLNIDATQLSLCGESSGGTIACAVTHELAATGEALVQHLALYYPLLDAAWNDSKTEYAHGCLIDVAFEEWGASFYLNSWEERFDPRVSPYYYDNVASMPPITMVKAQYDPMNSEIDAYCQRAGAFGVPVEAATFLGLTHAFGSFLWVPEIKDVFEWVCQRLQSRVTVPHRQKVGDALHAIA